MPQIALISEIFRCIWPIRSEPQSESDAIQAELASMRGQMAEFQTRLTNVESTVDQFVSSFEHRLAELAGRGAKAKQQAREELGELRRDLDTYIDILEMAVEAQLDMARRQDLRRLLTNARAKRTRIINVIALKVANDA